VYVRMNVAGSEILVSWEWDEEALSSDSGIFHHQLIYWRGYYCVRCFKCIFTFYLSIRTKIFDMF